MRYFMRTLLGVCLLAGVSFSAPGSSPGPIYQRILCVVPMVGSGTLADPRRPMFAPIAGGQPASLKKSKGFTDPPVIVSYHSVLSDDGASAIVEFVARDRAAFQPILTSVNPLVQAFQPGQLSAADLTARLQVTKKNFDLTSFLAGAR